MSRSRQVGHALELTGVVAAVVLAFLVNMVASRHFTRWDWTVDRRWSLSPATLETLHTLEQPVEIWTIAGSSDPLEPSLREAAYRSRRSLLYSRDRIDEDLGTRCHGAPLCLGPDNQSRGSNATRARKNWR